jgi:prolyl 4-hydroxylase
MNNINNNINNNFIGVYSIPDKIVMETIIDFFNQNTNLQKPGTTGDSEINTERKNNKEIRITPANLKEDKYKVFLPYIEYLKKCYLSYKNSYPFLEVLGNLNMGAFQIQKYEINGHCSAWHTERSSIKTSERVFAWMTYLNDVPKDGETEFLHYGIKIKPEMGKTIIWPAEWTHAHRGNPTTEKEKYILTGWLSLF